MGYNTRYRLMIKGPEDYDRSHMIEELRVSCQDAHDFLKPDGNNSGVEGSWWTYETDLEKFSREYPWLIFTIYSEGEECGDMRYSYFQDGKSFIADPVITFPPCPFEVLEPCGDIYQDTVIGSDAKQRLTP